VVCKLVGTTKGSLTLDSHDQSVTETIAGTRPIVAMRGISKKYANVVALSNVDLTLRSGEIVALVGDNGAGKSTLIKVLTGAVRPDTGEIDIDGNTIEITKPSVAQELGISAIYQDLALFNNLDASENVFAGREMLRRVLGIPFLRRKKMAQEAHQLLKRLGIVTMSSAKFKTAGLSGGQRQMIAVARAIGMKARVLVLDEPTAALGVRESTILLDLIRNLREQGMAILLVTHRVPDAMVLADRIVVLKAGEVHGELDPQKSVLDDVIELIVRGRATS
jgi:ABC-type sugar transport system ATPase subunit